MRPCRFSATVLFAVSAIASHQVFAQPGFGRVANTPYGGGVTVINNMTTPNEPSSKVKLGNSAISQAASAPVAASKPVSFPPRVLSKNFMNEFKTAWRNGRPMLIDSMMKYLDERNIGGGFRTSRNRIQIAEDGPLYVGTDARGFTIRFVLANNFLSTYLRTPTPLGADFDPGLMVNFDLDVSIDIDVVNNQLVAGPARVRPTVGKPVGKNVTGALAVAAADLVKTLEGVDFVGYMLSQVNTRTFDFPTTINSALAPLNPLLQKAAGRGTIMAGYNDATGNVTLTIRNAGRAPVVN